MNTPAFGTGTGGTDTISRRIQFLETSVPSVLRVRGLHIIAHQ
jgi:hypothetical protein